MTTMKRYVNEPTVTPNGRTLLRRQLLRSLHQMRFPYWFAFQFGRRVGEGEVKDMGYGVYEWEEALTKASPTASDSESS